MNFKAIFAVYSKELVDSLRDKRTLVSVVVIPTLITPALIFSIGRITMKVVERAKADVPAIQILGGEDSPKIVAALKASPKFNVIPPVDDWKERISDKKLRAAVLIPPGFEQALAQGKAKDVVIYHYTGELKSGFATDELTNFFSTLRQDTLKRRLSDRNLPPDLVEPFETKRENVAPPEKVGGNSFGGFVPYLIVILCFTGAMYPAMDLTAGEKERGTMETLLCSPVGRTEIVLGKFLMVLTGSLSAMALAMASLSLTLTVGGALLAGRAHGIPAGAAPSVIPSISPMGIIGTFAMVLPFSVLISAGLLTISLFARSFKEAQSYIAPLIFVIILPAVIGILPGVELNARFALVPILNLTLVCKEMLSGVWHWQYIALIFGSSCVYAGIALSLAVRMFNRESVIFRT